MINKNLINYLKNPKKKDKSWTDSLEDRKKEELEFHNFDREKSEDEILKKQKEMEIHSNKKFYSVTDSQSKYIDDWLKTNLKDKVFLDYACGDGLTSIKASEFMPSLIIGIDISDVSVENASKFAESKGLTNTFFLHADCENTELPDNSVDIILCQGMLHHLDLSIAFPELKRILKKGGKILCVEALSVNPLIQLYRDRTPEMRTEWEKAHILGPKELKFAKKFFRVSEVRYWFLFSLLSVPFRGTFVFKFMNKFFGLIDSIILKIPYVQRLSWQFTFVLNKDQ